MLARKLFRLADFRGQTRDAQSDLQRAEAVSQAVTEALSSLDAETAGLGRRVEALRAWVGGLIGPEDCSSSRRATEAEAELVDAERQLLQGVKRLNHLKDVRAVYSVIEAAIATERDRALQARLKAD